MAGSWLEKPAGKQKAARSGGCSDVLLQSF
jgi:hypothetical protein